MGFPTLSPDSSLNFEVMPECRSTGWRWTWPVITAGCGGGEGRIGRAEINEFVSFFHGFPPLCCKV